MTIVKVTKIVITILQTMARFIEVLSYISELQKQCKVRLILGPTQGPVIKSCPFKAYRPFSLIGPLQLETETPAQVHHADSARRRHGVDDDIVRH